MEKKEIKDALAEASDIVGELPQHLQEKAFELAVALILGGASPNSKARLTAREQALGSTLDDSRNDGQPNVSDLLKLSKRNSDRYIIFMHDLEAERRSHASGNTRAIRRLQRGYSEKSYTRPRQHGGRRLGRDAQ